MECNRDCFNCIHDDCIADAKTLVKKEPKQKTDRSAYWKDYYEKNKYTLKARAIERARRKNMEPECANCFKTITEPQMIYKYKRKVFCSIECIKEFLLTRAEDDVEEIWHDTKENMRICAEEERAKW